MTTTIPSDVPDVSKSKLPTKDGPWPPTSQGPIQAKYQEWSAWYSGDPQRLEQIYLGTSYSPGAAAAIRHDRPAQYQAGVIGKLARFFWGQPTGNLNNSSPKYHIPIASDLATANADMLFAEQVDIEHPFGDEFQECLDSNHVHALFPEGAEYAGFLGGVYYKVDLDKEISDYPIISIVPADCAIPTFAFGRLQSVIFWRMLHKDGNNVWWHLEEHTPGAVEHAVYIGTPTSIGRRVAFADVPDGTDIVDIADTIANLPPEHAGYGAASKIPTGTKGLNCVYIPNVRPGRWLGVPAATYLGRSDLQGIESLLDNLDEAWSSWMRDIRLGKGRILVPKQFLGSAGPGVGAVFNLDQEAFVGLEMPADGTNGTAKFEVAQFAIRVQEHEQTILTILESICRAAGYSTQMFGLKSNARLSTATEVDSRDKRTLLSREKKSRYWTQGLEDLLEIVAEMGKFKAQPPKPSPLDNPDIQSNSPIPAQPAPPPHADPAIPTQPPTPNPPAGENGGTTDGNAKKNTRVKVTFAAGTQDAPLVVAQTLQALAAAKAASTEVMVQMLHPDWDDEQVAAECEKISSAAAPLIDPLALGNALSDDPKDALPGQDPPKGVTPPALAPHAAATAAAAPGSGRPPRPVTPQR